VVVTPGIARGYSPGCSNRPDFSPAQPWRVETRFVSSKAAAVYDALSKRVAWIGPKPRASREHILIVRTLRAKGTIQATRSILFQHPVSELVGSSQNGQQTGPNNDRIYSGCKSRRCAFSNLWPSRRIGRTYFRPWRSSSRVCQFQEYGPRDSLWGRGCDSSAKLLPSPCQNCMTVLSWRMNRPWAAREPFQKGSTNR